MHPPLTRYDVARHALAEAHRVDEAKAIRDKMIAVKMYARQVNDKHMMVWATEIKLRAERRMGQLLIDLKETGQRAQQGGDRKSNPADRGLKLEDIGITSQRASESVQLADIPEKEFEAMLDEAKERKEVL